MNRYLKDSKYWLALSIVLGTVIVSVATYFRWLVLRVAVGPFYLDHWLVLLGSLYVGIVTPLFYILKRRYRARISSLTNLHIFGNSLSFTGISMHFAQQIGRPAQFYPDLGTGVALFLVMAILVASGFLHKFQIIKSVKPHSNRFLHVSVTTAFYLVIGIHILQGFDLL
jgi:hypothetical protein